MAKSDINITDIRGGLDSTDTPAIIPPDQCREAENVEFFRSALGERRKGASVVTIANSGLENEDYLTFLYRYLPSSGEADAELWAFSVTPSTNSVLARKTTLWMTVSPYDAFTISGSYGFQLVGKTLHGKLYIAAKTAVDRLHVWDGTSFRRVGMESLSTAPTAADTGSGGFTTTRYYRTREVVQASGVTILRSESSTVRTFSPSGSGSGAQVTKPTTVNLSPAATHWEIEASLNNTDFYRLSTIAIGITTYTDTLTTYAATGVLSDDSGDNTAPTSCKFLAVDEDRLLMAGSFETSSLSSRVSWTPVFGATGVGNDERIPIDTDNFIDLNTNEGGEITGISDGVNGSIYVFKHSHIYKMVRTGDVTAAYSATTVTKQIGALPGSLVSGVDQRGSPCLYFLDPEIGPCRIGEEGYTISLINLKTVSGDIQTTWNTVNLDASKVISRGIYYPSHKQVIWWVATGSSDLPDLKLVLQTDSCRVTDDGVRKGWSTGTGPSATALCACLYSDNIEDDTTRGNNLKPFIGIQSAGNGKILMLDTGTSDDGTAFFGHVTTRPYFVAGLLNNFGVMSGSILADSASGVTLYITGIKNLGEEELTKSIDLSPINSEDHVIRDLDNLNFSELRSISVRYGDDPDELDTPVGDWEVDQIVLKVRSEQTS